MTNSQSGIALLALLALLGLAAALFVVAIAGGVTRKNETNERSAAALAQAKEALIGYAANYRDSNPDEVFGYLPCPDISTTGTEGSADTSAAGCASKDVTVIGRLPWRTLGLPPLRDGDGECLWYAVSGNFKANVNKTDLMNWDTNGLIEIVAPDGTNFVAGGSGVTANPTRRAAAVIFAAGAILPGQDRAPPGTSPPQICGGNYAAAAYLDTDVSSMINNATAASGSANTLSRFIAAADSALTPATDDSFNDRLVFIAPGEIFAARAEKRDDFLPYLNDEVSGMLRRAADCIAAYGNANSSSSDRRLPWAVPLVYSNYGLDSNYDDAAGLISGRFPRIVDTSDSATNNTLVSAGGLLLSDSVCANWTTRDEFWQNFKDHMFYAVADAFKPTSAVASSADPCASAECLKVDGATGIAAVVIFAGRKQSGQDRNTNTDYSSPDKSFWSTTTPPYSNFLSATNALSIQDNTAAMATPRTFEKFVGNDTIMCIRKNSGTGLLIVDPTCSANSACNVDGDALVDLYRSGTTNLCKVGKKNVLQECKDLVDTINANNCSCEQAARKFIKKPCLDNLGDSKCTSVITDLQNCS